MCGEARSWLQVCDYNTDKRQFRFEIYFFFKEAQYYFMVIQFNLGFFFGEELCIKV